MGPSLLVMEAGHREPICPWPSPSHPFSSQGLFPGSFPSLPQVITAAFSSSFRLQPKDHLLREAFPDYLVSSSLPRPMWSLAITSPSSFFFSTLTYEIILWACSSSIFPVYSVSSMRTRGSSFLCVRSTQSSAGMWKMPKYIQGMSCKGGIRLESTPRMLAWCPLYAYLISSLQPFCKVGFLCPFHR